MLLCMSASTKEKLAAWLSNAKFVLSLRFSYSYFLLLSGSTVQTLYLTKKVQKVKLLPNVQGPDFCKRLVALFSHMVLALAYQNGTGNSIPAVENFRRLRKLYLLT